MARTKAQPKEKAMEVTVTRRVKLLEKVCPNCGKTFWGPKVRIYCTGRGGACANRASYLKHAEQRRQQRMEKYYAEKKAAKSTRKAG
jgi:hypothetical protein